MTVKVFVDWDNREIINEDEHNKIINRLAEGRRTDNHRFNEWLNDNYLPAVIWGLTDAGRRELERRWAEECLEEAEENDDYEETIIEI